MVFLYWNIFKVSRLFFILATLCLYNFMACRKFSVAEQAFPSFPKFKFNLS